MAAVRKTAGRQQNLSQLPVPSSHHTPAPRSLHPFSSAPAGQQDNRISCEFQEQAEIGQQGTNLEVCLRCIGLVIEMFLQKRPASVSGYRSHIL